MNYVNQVLTNRQEKCFSFIKSQLSQLDAADELSVESLNVMNQTSSWYPLSSRSINTTIHDCATQLIRPIQTIHRRFYPRQYRTVFFNGIMHYITIALITCNSTCNISCYMLECWLSLASEGSNWRVNRHNCGSA